MVRRRLSIFRTFIIQGDIFLDAHRNTLPGITLGEGTFMSLRAHGGDFISSILLLF